MSLAPDQRSAPLGSQTAFNFCLVVFDGERGFRWSEVLYEAKGMHGYDLRTSHFAEAGRPFDGF